MIGGYAARGAGAVLRAGRALAGAAALAAALATGPIPGAPSDPWRASGAAMASDAPAIAPPLAREARIEGRWGRAELAVLTTAPTAFRVFSVEDPMRVIVDLPGLHWPKDAAIARGGLIAGDGGGLIAAARVGAPRPGSTRIVLELAEPARIERALGEAAADGHRISVSLARATEAEFAADAGWPEGARAASAVPPRAADEVLIAIDPGHGGVDPGALAPGATEKDLVLAYARALKTRIDARPGFRAALTRESDHFMSLRDRVRFAQAARADAFLSIHADALETGSAFGASVYTLSEAASDAEAAALVGSRRASELAGAPLDAEEDDVARVLVDLARRRTDRRSSALGASLAAALSRESEVLSGRALRGAGFRVLKAPDVPSALIEIGFLSSAEDLDRLLSPQGRDALTRTIAEAVFAWADRDPVLQARLQNRSDDQKD